MELDALFNDDRRFHKQQALLRQRVYMHLKSGDLVIARRAAVCSSDSMWFWQVEGEDKWPRMDDEIVKKNLVFIGYL